MRTHTKEDMSGQFGHIITLLQKVSASIQSAQSAALLITDIF